MTKVTIPSSVISIGVGIFDGCPHLTEIIYDEKAYHYGDELFDKLMCGYVAERQGNELKYSIWFEKWLHSPVGDSPAGRIDGPMQTHAFSDGNI